MPTPSKAKKAKAKPVAKKKPTRSRAPKVSVRQHTKVIVMGGAAAQPANTTQLIDPYQGLHNNPHVSSFLPHAVRPSADNQHAERSVPEAPRAQVSSISEQNMDRLKALLVTSALEKQGFIPLSLASPLPTSSMQGSPSTYAQTPPRPSKPVLPTKRDKELARLRDSSGYTGKGKNILAQLGGDYA
jgi:hypothetical protein